MAETGEKGIDSDIEENCDRDAANSHWRNYWIRGEWWSHGIFTSGDQKKLYLRVHLSCKLLCHVILCIISMVDFNHFFIAHLYFNRMTSF